MNTFTPPINVASTPPILVTRTTRRTVQRATVRRTAAWLTTAVLGTAIVCGAAMTVPASSPLGPPSAQAATVSCPAPRAGVLTTVPATQSKNVALTFDDGPSPKWTPQVLDILKANHVHATFFMLGQNARAYPSLVRRVVAEGHTVGNHSYSHPNLTKLPTKSQATQIDSASRYISAAVKGGFKVCFLRPPYGSYNSTTVSLARSRGMSTVTWSRDTRDWTTPLHRSVSFQSAIVRNATRPQSSHPDILMHDGSPGNYRQNTVSSLQRVITYYKSRGYRFTNPAGR
jgi:peptidoglycan/xylan/chitin deacetylase (PgdA/CDA1 family)